MKIAYFILNSFDFDSRARLEIELLKQLKHQVEIIATVGGESHSYLGFPIHRLPQWRGPTRKFRFLQYNFLAARLAQNLKPDICHAVDLDTLQAAVWAAKSSGAKIVYESRELYTELEALAGRTRIKNIWKNLETKLIARADLVFTINNSIAAELEKRYGIKKPPVVRNVASLPKLLSPIDLREKLDIPQKHKILIYQGVLRQGQGLISLLDIIARLPKNIVLVLVGNGPIDGELKKYSEKLEIANRVKFVGQVTPSELLNYSAGADVGVLLMEDIALNNRLALPQKLFQYLVAGIPQIVSTMPEIAGFVSAEQTGLVIDTSNLEDGAGQIAALMNDNDTLDKLKLNCKEVAGRHNWQLESLILANLYRGLEN